MQITLELLPGGIKKYPLIIDADDEGLVREAAKQLRGKINAYRHTFSEVKDLSEIDILAMVAVDIAVSHLRIERKNDIVPFTTKIQQLNETLKSYLKEQ